MAVIFVIDNKETQKLRLLTVPRIGDNVKINNKEEYTVDKVEHDVDLKNPLIVDIRIFLKKSRPYEKAIGVINDDATKTSKNKKSGAI